MDGRWRILPTERLVAEGLRSVASPCLQRVLCLPSSSTLAWDAFIAYQDQEETAQQIAQQDYLQQWLHAVREDRAAQTIL